jgi:hypothetical protein
MLIVAFGFVLAGVVGRECTNGLGNSFCGTRYPVSADLDQINAAKLAQAQYEQYSAIARDESCRVIYRDYLCAFFFPGCVQREAELVSVCREQCVYSKLCGLPVNSDCNDLNTVHPQEWMVRGDGTGNGFVHCLGAEGGKFSPHYIDKEKFQLHKVRSNNYRQWPFMPNIAQYAHLHGSGKHSLGMDGVDNFSWADRMFLDFVLTNHPEFRHLVELGTYRGETSLLLGTIARTRGGTLTTFDIGDMRRPEVLRAWLPEMTFKQEDVLSTFNPNVEAALNGDARFVLFDNGKKVEEVNVYAGSLAVGSAFLVHDWDQEVVYSAVEETIVAHSFQSRYNDLAEELNSHLRFFIRVQSTPIQLADGTIEHMIASPFEDVAREVAPWCAGFNIAEGDCSSIAAQVQKYPGA